jgi:hypothetical protein
MSSFRLDIGKGRGAVLPTPAAARLYIMKPDAAAAIEKVLRRIAIASMKR